ncbi:MAG: hypothetical protein AABZ39_03675 [Spirochaetota bacterium]
MYTQTAGVANPPPTFPAITGETLADVNAANEHDAEDGITNIILSANATASTFRFRVKINEGLNRITNVYIRWKGLSIGGTGQGVYVYSNAGWQSIGTVTIDVNTVVQTAITNRNYAHYERTNGSNFINACMLGRNQGGGTDYLASDYFEVATFYELTPDVENTTGATNVGSNYATLNGTYEHSGDTNVRIVLYWGTNDGGTTAANWQNALDLGWYGSNAMGGIATNLYGLSEWQKYYYRAWSSNAHGVAWSTNTSSFTTLFFVASNVGGSAYTSLQAAIDAAADGSEIRVRGTNLTRMSGLNAFPETNGISVMDKNDLRIIGGYGPAFSVQTGYTTLDGGGASTYNRLLYLSNASGLTLDAFVIRGGGTNSVVTPVLDGTGLAAYDSHRVVFTNLIISNCISSNGGGMSLRASSNAVVHVTAMHNYAARYGGGVMFNRITNGILSGNIVSNNSDYAGGGVMVQGKSNTLYAAVVSNSAYDAGGGLFFWGSDGDLIYSSVKYNAVRGNSATEGGGGIGLWVCTNVSVSGNISENQSATVGGGIFSYSSSNTVIKSCFFSNNISTITNATIHFNGPTTAVAPFIVSSNVFHGGGVNAYAVLESVDDIVNQTIVSNVFWTNAMRYLYGDPASIISNDQIALLNAASARHDASSVIDNIVMPGVIGDTPFIVITNPAPLTEVSGVASFQGSNHSAASIAGFWYSVNGGPWNVHTPDVNWSIPIDTSMYPLGIIVLGVKAIYTAGPISVAYCTNLNAAVPGESNLYEFPTNDTIRIWTYTNGTSFGATHPPATLGPFAGEIPFDISTNLDNMEDVFADVSIGDTANYGGFRHVIKLNETLSHITNIYVHWKGWCFEMPGDVCIWKSSTSQWVKGGRILTINTEVSTNVGPAADYAVSENGTNFIHIICNAKASGGAGPLHNDFLEMKTFTCPFPLVNNASGATNVSDSSAALTGMLEYDSGQATRVWMYWGTNDGGTAIANWSNVIDMGSLSSGGFATNVYGLAPLTTCYYRCLASNIYGPNWATATTNFITQPAGGASPVIASNATTGLAFNNLQDAITNAAAGHEIRVLATNLTRAAGHLNALAKTNALFITNKNNLTIKGGYDAPFASQTGKTVIDGGGASFFNRLVFVSSLTNLTLDGFVLRGGGTNAASAIQDGTGIVVMASTKVLISNFIFSNNYSTNGGGAGFVNCTNVALDAVFMKNYALNTGGALYDLNGMSNTMRGTFASNASFATGGGVYVQDSAHIRIDGIFVSNSSPVGGGGYVLHRHRTAPLMGHS